MCGIFGIISDGYVNRKDLKVLAQHSAQRGRDSSGLISYADGRYHVHRADFSLRRLLKTVQQTNSTNIVFGHSRLITNGLSDNQPVLFNDIAVLHNGIIVNHEEVWSKLDCTRTLEIDTEIIAAITQGCIENKVPLTELHEKIFELCSGVVAAAVILPKLGKMCLFSNNGSLYVGSKRNSTYFSSERFPLEQVGCSNMRQVRNSLILDIAISGEDFSVSDIRERTTNLIPGFFGATEGRNVLEHRQHNLRRCSKCILPETMPFILFDQDGVCNYCRKYQPRNHPRPITELIELLEPYRRANAPECIVPLSGGRDSSYGLHLIVNELNLRPLTFSYDWGMVTDLGRRNISRMSSKLGVENIIIADDIEKKRRYIAMNLKAWLKSPNLGMLSILTAGDKHFFRHLRTIQRQTSIGLNLWGINPLEVTHFKAGFLGVPPDFEETRVYSHGAIKQMHYQTLRLRAMSKSPGYFNRSLWDTLSGEYYRSFSKKPDYFHIFDYWRWDEEQIDRTLESYDWERAPDTSTTWRIGDGTAAFYNYVYYTVAGFTEHDTFRSNQIREGDISRQQALDLVRIENAPRFLNLKWYLDVLGFDFESVIKVVNNIPRLF